MNDRTTWVNYRILQPEPIFHRNYVIRPEVAEISLFYKQNKQVRVTLSKKY